MLNKVTVMGRLVKDIEIRKAGDASVCNFAIACERDYTTEDGTRPCDFLDCVAWRGTADFLDKYFRKGDMVIVSGSLQKRKWEDEDGNARYNTEIIADNVYFGQVKKTEETEKKSSYKKSSYKK